MEKGDDKYPLVKHMKSEHPDDVNNYTMHMVSSHQYNLQRQILEGLYINEASERENAKLLNSKSEWGRAKIYRLRIEDSQGGS